MAHPLEIFLGALLALTFAGRFLPGPAAWGFNHLAYLPVWFFVLWTLAALAYFWPALRRRWLELLAGPLPRALFTRASSPFLWAPVAAGLFVLLRERSFFMGDGYLIGELQDQGVKFRAFDALDFLIHYQVFHAWHALRPSLSAFTVYRAASVVAGVGAVILHAHLIRKLSWDPWRRAAAYLMLFFLGPAVLYFGYVESYTYLFLFLTGFLLTGLLVLEERAPLWVAATLFGLGLAFHLTAVASGAALLYLGLRAPVRPAWKRWCEVFIPPAALFALAFALHLAAGYNAFWFRKEFLENKNTQSLWIPWASGRGLFSFYLWKDQFNLLLITAPVCLGVVLTQTAQLRRRWREPRLQFLLAQMLPIVVCSIVLDRKLGGARDWDLLAAHSAGLVLLAVLLLPSRAVAETPERSRSLRQDAGRPVRGPKSLPDPSVGLVLGAAFLVAVPWVFLLHLEPRSITRFVSVAADFPAFPRAYAYEEVGKYYRKADDLETAQEMYERCVQSYPGNARFHVLLGSIHFMRKDFVQADSCYARALRCDPRNYMAVEMRAKVALERKNWESALRYTRSLVGLRGQAAASWELLGLAGARADQPEESVRGFRRAMELDPAMDHWHDLGAALLRLGRNTEATTAFRQALSRQNTQSSRLGLAWSLLGAARDEFRQGRTAPTAWLDEAQSQAQAVLEESGGKETNAEDLLRSLDDLRRFRAR